MVVSVVFGEAKSSPEDRATNDLVRDARVLTKSRRETRSLY